MKNQRFREHIEFYHYLPTRTNVFDHFKFDLNFGSLIILFDGYNVFTTSFNVIIISIVRVKWFIK